MDTRISLNSTPRYIEAVEALDTHGLLFTTKQRRHRLDGVVFMSHQWAGYSHPDPFGIKYTAMLTSVRELRSRGVRANWVWLDAWLESSQRSLVRVAVCAPRWLF